MLCVEVSEKESINIFMKVFSCSYGIIYKDLMDTWVAMCFEKHWSTFVTIEKVTYGIPYDG
jgi:hypothetical protein